MTDNSDYLNHSIIDLHLSTFIAFWQIDDLSR